MASNSPIRIERIAAGGDGVGRLADGRTVFVPRTAPGDLVEPVQLRMHKRFARARPGRLVEAAPERVEPPCPHYVADECGGCQLQHLAYAAQLAAKRGFVGDALRRLGRLEVEDPEIERAPEGHELGYRTKITLAASADGRRIGLHPYDRPDRVFELEWCHITAEPLNRLWQAVRRARTRLPRHLTHLVLRLDREGGRHLIVRTGAGQVWSGGPALGAELARLGEPAVVWLQPEGGSARAVHGAGEAFPATVFEQVHPAMGARAREWALEGLGAAAGLHAWDLYAGIGETTERLAAAGATVESVEWDRRAVEWAEDHAVHRRPQVARYAGPVEQAVSALRPPELIVTNPPRVGMDPAAVAALAESGARRIAYVSCDAATLARDLARLGERYRVASLRAFDLFPQTAHVESVAHLELRS